MFAHPKNHTNEKRVRNGGWHCHLYIHCIFFIWWTYLLNKASSLLSSPLNMLSPFNQYNMESINSYVMSCLIALSLHLILNLFIFFRSETILHSSSLCPFFLRSSTVPPPPHRLGWRWLMMRWEWRTSIVLDHDNTCHAIPSTQTWKKGIFFAKTTLPHKFLSSSFSAPP